MTNDRELGGKVDWARPVLMQFGPTEGCGCPMEEWIYRGINMAMHFEPDGSVDVHFDTGDWEREETFCSRDAVFEWIDALPFDDDLAA